MKKATTKELEAMTETEFRIYAEARVQSLCPKTLDCGPCQYGTHNKNIKTWPCHHKCEEHRKQNR